MKWRKLKEEIGLWCICRKFPEKCTLPTWCPEVNQTLLSVPHSSRSLSKHQHQLVVILQYEFYRMTQQCLPVSLLGCSQYLVVRVIPSTKEHLWLFMYCSCNNFSFSLPLPNLWWQLLFETASEIAGQLKSAGWQQRHYKSSKPKEIAPCLSLGPREAALSTRNVVSAMRPIWSRGRARHKGGGTDRMPRPVSRCEGESKGLEGFVPGWQHSKVEKPLRLRYKNATGWSNSSTVAGLAMGSEDSDGL